MAANRVEHLVSTLIEKIDDALSVGKAKYHCFRCYLLTVLLMAFALWLRLAIAPLSAGLQYLTFFPAVTLAAIFFGYRAGLLATLIGIGLATMVLTPPYYAISLAVLKLSAWPNMVFFMDGVVISFSIQTMHRLRQGFQQKLLEARDAEIKVVALNRRLEELLAENERTTAKLLENQNHLRAIIDNEPECIKIVDAQGRLKKMNPAGLALIEATSFDQVAMLPVREVVAPQYRAAFDEMHQQVLAGMPMTIELEIIGLKGGSRWVETHAVPMQDNGQVVQLAVTHDITKRKQAEIELRIAAAAFETHEAIMITDVDARVLRVNRAFETVTGYAAEEVMGQNPRILSSGRHERKFYEDMWRQVLESGTWSGEVWDRRKDGNIFPTHMTITAVKNAAGETTQYVCIFLDISERKIAEDALRQTEELAKQSLEELKYQKFALDHHAIVAVTDVQGRITYANKMFCEISGYSLDELIGQDHAILNSGHHPKGFFKQMYQTVASGEAWHDEVCNRAKDGHLYWVDTTIAPFMGEDGKPHRYISIRTDISQRKAAEEKSNHLALYDALTELPNRRLLMDRLKQVLVSAERSGKMGALLFIDLDNFKNLNDTLGHDIGDLLLLQVAQRLVACVREADTVARLGGDEYVVVLEDLNGNLQDVAFQTEATSKKILEMLNLPYQLDGHEYHSTPSIGVTLISGSQVGKDELMKRADIAMYQAKKAGRNAIRFFDPEMQAAVETRSALENSMRQALSKGQFQLYYQMQVELSGKIVGAEVLLRWQHPEHGMISPADFIPLAEETGHIVPIGLWVLETACNQIKAWEDDPDKQSLQLAVNVSARQFRQPDFVEMVTDVLRRSGINPRRLKLELTESLVLDNITETIKKMRRLKDIGVKFSMDDFGTGHSSLSSLKKLPLDQLKIDQSFVRDITSDQDDATIVQTIIAMAKHLGMEVIAEGVETEEQRDFLTRQGCMHFQGYLFSKPVPLEEFDQRIGYDRARHEEYLLETLPAG